MTDTTPGLRLGHKLHDSFFRALFGRPQVAAAALRGLLPPPLVDALDLDRLAPMTGDFVTRALTQRHTDLLFEVPLRDHPAHIVWIYEQDTRARRLAAWRALDYATLIVRHAIETHRREHGRDPERLPAVIPLVLHTGRRPWKHPKTFTELVDLPPALIPHARPYLPDLTLHVDHLHTVSDAALRARHAGPPATLGWVLLKGAPGANDLDALLGRWKSELRALAEMPGGRDALTLMTEYSLRVSQTPREQVGRAFREVLGPEGEEIVMTTGQQLEALGRKQGKLEGKIETVTRLLTLRFGRVPPAVAARVAAEQREAVLDRWTERIFTASSPEDLVAED